MFAVEIVDDLLRRSSHCLLLIDRFLVSADFELVIRTTTVASSLCARMCQQISNFNKAMNHTG